MLVEKLAGALLGQKLEIYMSDFYKGPLKVVVEYKHKFNERSGYKTEFKNFWVRHDDGTENPTAVFLASNEYSMTEAEAAYRANLVASAPEMRDAAATTLNALLSEFNQKDGGVFLTGNQVEILCARLSGALKKARGEA